MTDIDMIENYLKNVGEDAVKLPHLKVKLEFLWNEVYKLRRKKLYIVPDESDYDDMLFI